MMQDHDIEKVARKKSSDPAQEQLRQAKDDWNLQVKQLIALLIPFKRGMNGKGDAKIGIPPSNIKDPLPPQLGQYLNEIATRYTKIVEDAHKIIDAQNYYSQHRRKTQPNKPRPANDVERAPMGVAATFEPALITEASWWGSQAWARIALLKKIDRVNRRIRIDMLGSGIHVWRDFKKFESMILDYKNPDGIPEAVRILASLSLDFSSVFLRLYDKLEVIYDNLPTQPPAENKPKKSKQTAENAEGEPNTEIWQKFKDIYAQLVKIEVVVKYLSIPENVAKYNTQALKSLYDIFVRDLTVLYELNNRTDHGKNPVELERLATDVVNKYQQLLQLSGQALGTSSDFNELANKIPKPTVASYMEIVENQKQIKKLADDAVTRWLRKTWLSINPNNLDRMRLEMAQTSVDFRKQLNSLLDLLEDRNIGIADISAQNSAACKILADLIDQAMALSKSHMITHKTRKTKEHAALEIHVSDLRILREVKQSIETYIKSK